VLPERANGETEASPHPAGVRSGDLKLIARDAKKNPLFSAWEWTPAAVERILRVPAGYMRERTQERVETLAAERQATAIDVELVEGGIEIGRQLMEQLLGERGGEPETDAARAEEDAQAGKCPFTAAAAQAEAPSRGNGNGNGMGGPYLNEVGLMSALQAKRKPAEE
jgi:hypothetical protein